MENKFTLFYKETCGETLACLAALECAGLEITLSKIEQKTLHSKDFKKFNPASLTPCLVSEHTQVVSAPAIIRYAGLRQPELYGNTLIEKAHVDQFIELSFNQINPEVSAIMNSIYGKEGSIMDFRELEKNINEWAQEISFIERIVKGKTHLVNNKLTLADICFVSSLEQFFRFALNSKQRNQLKVLFTFVSQLISQTELKHYFRELCSLADSTFNFLKIDKVLIEKQKEEERKKKEEEEAHQKALNEAMLKEEQEMLKDPVFPESKVNFDAWKNTFCQEKDLQTKLQFARESHDENGYSFWKLDYDKLPNTLKDELPASNCFVSFVNRCDVFRKYVYAVHTLVEKDGDYNIRGLWYMRGPEKLSNLCLNQDTDYYFYKKLDPKNDQEWKQICDFFSLNKESEGKTVIDGEKVVLYSVIC